MPHDASDYFVLRGQWLRFRSQVHDANTELPTLGAVLDDVRRLVEERGSLGLVYLDLASSAGLEVLHGWQAYDEVLRGVARVLRGMRDDGTLAPRDVLAVLAVRADKFVLFLSGGGSQPLDAKGLAASFSRVRERLEARLPASLPGFVSAPLRVSMGHAVLYRDPMLRAERGVHRALDEAIRMCLEEQKLENDRTAADLQAILERGEVVTLLQPILDLADRSVLGHEVFSRGPSGSPLEDPERLFEAAEHLGRSVDLERLCRRRALLTSASRLTPGAKLFLNTSAPALHDPQLAGDGFLGELDAQGLSPRDVVLELKERVAVEDRPAQRETVRRLKEAGLGIAIDDMGAGYSSLQSIVELEPDFLKFDIALVRNIDRSRIKRSLLETVVELSERIGARVIAEGIEAEAEFRTLREMGVPLGQGRYLAPPAPVSEERRN